jgi:2,3-bisphosphoglycerate-independent phosphoglycerate mutase
MPPIKPDRSSPRPRPVVLCILDGFGMRVPAGDNAISLAKAPVWSRLTRAARVASIGTSGADVGLPDGQMGNSEVGHMNIGSGRIAVPELARVDTALANGEFAANPALRDLIAKLKAGGGKLHLMGLLSPGGVHSHQDHMAAAAIAAAGAGVPVVVHGFLDGRDTPPQSAIEFLGLFAKAIAAAPMAAAKIAFGTIIGRYYAMDRDKRWERTARAYEALVDGHGPRAADARQAVEHGYAAGATDEFLPPAVVGDYAGMKDGDGLFMANFRADRARQILTALLDPDFEEFPRARMARFAQALGMVEYSAHLARLMPAMFQPVRYAKVLGELIAAAGLRQLRVAETEKYAHVTFFFNGGEETVFPGEDRVMVPSPKVATYDLQPEMSAVELTDRLVAAIASGTYDFIVVNYANPDMVGHSGKLAAAIQAVECVDRCLGRLEAAIEKSGGVLLITADHGNLEQMLDPATGQPHTQHTTNPVPAVLLGPGATAFALADGRLSDIAPTLLPFLGLAQPAEMTGRSLLRPAMRSERRASL